MSTYFGYPGRDDRWTDDSGSGIDRRVRHLASTLETVRGFDRSALPGSLTLDYDLYLEALEGTQDGLRYGGDPLPFRLGEPHNLWMPVNQMEGIHLTAGELADVQPRKTAQDLEDRLARLERLPVALDQNQALLSAGLDRGCSPPRMAVRGVPEQVRRLAPEDPRLSPLVAPVLDRPAGVAPEVHDRIRDRAIRLMDERVGPSLLRFAVYLESDYLPHCRESFGASELPNGRAWYSHLVRWETTTDRTPEEVHEIGVREVQRIRTELSARIARTGFSGSYAAFNEFLRTDRRFVWPSGPEMVDGYRALAKRIDPELGRLFGRLPRLPYGVLPVPPFRETSSPTAYYLPGAPSTGRAGIFYANTYRVEVRPRWEMEALALHEAVPGHHLQMGLAQELDALPEFRRNTGATAFIEGWGLYAESLGEEIGLYVDPYAKIGQLNFDLWRAIRLVVDTGLHAFGWTRDRAIEFFRENSGKSDVDIAVEVDRYLVWPGQALAYKMGQLKIRELRSLAEEELGDRFDVRAFHDLVLSEGALPLGVLERRVRAWIEARRPG